MEYRQFVDFIFDRPPRSEDWYFTDGFVDLELRPETAVQLTTKVLNDLGLHADRFTELQLCLGLNYLINPSCSGHCYLLLDTSVCEDAKIALFASMYEVFRSVFDGRCAPILSNQAPTHLRSYNGVCYMWWHIFPRHGVPRRPDLDAIDRIILEKLIDILGLGSEACKESALHGLGHWHVAYPEFVERTIDSALSAIPKDLTQYAKNARAGNVQ